MSPSIERSSWRVGDQTSSLFLDLAAGRPTSHHSRLTRDELRLAFRHGLLGTLAHSPDPLLRDPAGPIYLLLAAQRERMKVGLHRVLVSLEEAGIPAAVVKGPFMASKYRNPALRTYSDIDLLVRRESLDRALEVVAADPAVAAIPPKKPDADKRDIPFRDPTGHYFNLDVHWDLFSYTQLRGCARNATASAWDSAIADPHHELGPLWHLPVETRLGFLCTHAILDHRFRLILFRDLAEISAHPDCDWERIVDFAGRWHLRSVTYLAWLMAARLVDAQVPAEVLAELRPSNLPIRILEAMLPRTDVVHFEGHRPHPVNLATVLLHDHFADRFKLAMRAPMALPGWVRKVSSPRSGLDRQIMIVVTSNRRRGAEVFGERLQNGLKGLGWRASLVALTKVKDGGSTVGAVPVTDRAVGMLGRLNRDVVTALRREIRASQPRIVVAGGSATLQYSLAATLGLRNRPALAYMSIGEPSYWMRGRRRKLGHRLMLSQFDLIVSVSSETARQLIEDVGIDPNRVRVAHTGVPPRFLVEPDLAGRGSSPELRLLFLGNLSMEKDPLVAIRVLSRLSVPARLRLVGSGPMMERVQKEISRLNLDGRVEAIGSVADVLPHLAWADVLVLTSRTEGLPGAVLEAAATGVPAVAFDVGGTRETIVDGITGRLIAPGDLAGMAYAIEELADPERRGAAGRAAAEFIRREFTLEHAVLHHHDLLLELLSDADKSGEE